MTDLRIEVLIAKLHRITVTEANLDYVGSITLDPVLMEAAGLKQWQYVNITNLRNGIFWRTYIMPGERGRGDVCLNGPPAHHFQPGDLIIVLAQGTLPPDQLEKHDPIVVFVDKNNKVTEIKHHGNIPHGTIAN